MRSVTVKYEPSYVRWGWAGPAFASQGKTQERKTISRQTRPTLQFSLRQTFLRLVIQFTTEGQMWEGYSFISKKVTQLLHFYDHDPIAVSCDAGKTKFSVEKCDLVIHRCCTGGSRKVLTFIARLTQKYTGKQASMP